MRSTPVQDVSISQPAFENPSISVVIPAYNAADFLGEALKSALSQTYAPQEVIVVDDGSEDQTSAIATAFAGHVKYIRKKNGGPASARNVGIREASGEWIAFLDSDDIWMPNLLESLARTASQTRADFVFCDSRQLIDGKAEGRSRLETYNLKTRLGTLAPNGVLLDPFQLLLEERCYIFTPGVLVRRDVLLDVGLFDEAFYCGEDLDLWLRLSLRYRFAVIDEVLHLRRIHGKNTGYNWWAKVRGDLQVYEKLERYNPAIVENPKLHRLLRRKKAYSYRELAALHTTLVELESARESCAKSLHYSFSPMAAILWLATFLPRPCFAAALNWKRKIRSTLPLRAAGRDGIAGAKIVAVGASEGERDMSA